MSEEPPDFPEGEEAAAYRKSLKSRLSKTLESHDLVGLDGSEHLETILRKKLEKKLNKLKRRAGLSAEKSVSSKSKKTEKNSNKSELFDFKHEVERDEGEVISNDDDDKLLRRKNKKEKKEKKKKKKKDDIPPSPPRYEDERDTSRSRRENSPSSRRRNEYRRDDRNRYDEYERYDENRRVARKDRNMPEHLKWLHSRWRTNDSTALMDSKRRKRDDDSDEDRRRENRQPTRDERKEYERRKREGRRPSPMRQVREGVWVRDQGPVTSSNSMPLGERRQLTASSSTQPEKTESEEKSNARFTAFTKGESVQAGVSRLLSFKEFCVTLPSDIKNHEKAIEMYGDYKLEYRRTTLAEFFAEHSEEEWFLEKYHPMLRAEALDRRQRQISKRCDVFMQLLVRGWCERVLDVENSRDIRKFIDACTVLLEGGDEGDLAMLDKEDYSVVEQKELTYNSMIKKQEYSDSEEEDDYKPDADENDPRFGKAPGGGRRIDEQQRDEKMGDCVSRDELESMIHAKDYSLYIEQHKVAGRDVSDLPDNIDNVRREAQKIATGVFVSTPAESKQLEEMNLHRTSALLLRNLPPTITREEVLAICAESHGGFLRLRMLQPEPFQKWYRQAVATYWHNANLTKITWKVRGTVIKGSPLQVFEFREFKRRIELADGIAGDKSIVLRDIQLAKSLIEYFDARAQLWGQEPHDKKKEPGESADDKKGMGNPLLMNLDECLAFHLKEMMEGKDAEAESLASLPKSQRPKISKDANLCKILDRLLLYLRVVHSVDYYACKFHENEDDEPRRIGTVTLRDLPEKHGTQKRLTRYIRTFETRLKDMMPADSKLANEHVEVLGKRDIDKEIEKFIQANTITIADQMTKCTLCFKRFTTPEFAAMHITSKHADRLEEVKWIVLTFNNYLYDTKRPTNPLVRAQDLEMDEDMAREIAKRAKTEIKVEEPAHSGLFAPPAVIQEPINFS